MNRTEDRKINIGEIFSMPKEVEEEIRKKLEDKSKEEDYSFLSFRDYVKVLDEYYKEEKPDFIKECEEFYQELSERKLSKDNYYLNICESPHNNECEEILNTTLALGDEKINENQEIIFIMEFLKSDMLFNIKGKIMTCQEILDEYVKMKDSKEQKEYFKTVISEMVCSFPSTFRPVDKTIEDENDSRKNSTIYADLIEKARKRNILTEKPNVRILAGENIMSFYTSHNIEWEEGKRTLDNRVLIMNAVFDDKILKESEGEEKRIFCAIAGTGHTFNTDGDRYKTPVVFSTLGNNFIIYYNGQFYLSKDQGRFKLIIFETTYEHDIITKKRRKIIAKERRKIKNPYFNDEKMFSGLCKILDGQFKIIHPDQEPESEGEPEENNKKLKSNEQRKLERIERFRHKRNLGSQKQEEPSIFDDIKKMLWLF